MTSDRWAKVERLYHAALAHDAGERAAFLREACADDDSLRREVESLLAQPVSGDFVAAPAIAVAAELVSGAETPPLKGRRFGVYQILELIGAGGMGEVYRARDTRLGRDVAIKILPRAFTAHPDRLARFEREARVLASLNHPHIAAIYGIEDVSLDDGQPVRALILELVEGETLAERITRAGTKGVPLTEALAIARQTADALDAAHEKGIIHRDLKPANIKITAQGAVKVLDFGLAKLEAVGAGEEFTDAPTITVNDTHEGLVIGTAAYMSPEQARGKAVDKRTDIWAFGCVLYELITGRAAFGRETVNETIAAILERDPDWNGLTGVVPSAVHSLLQRCLKKDPRHRLRDIGDAVIEIDGASHAAEFSTATPVNLSTRRRVVIAAVVLAVGVAIGVGLMYKGLPAVVPSAPEIVRFTATLPQNDGLIALSPDGSHLAYASQIRGAPNKLLVRAFDQFETRTIPGSDGATSPFFSPDGEWIGFFANGQLKKIALNGTSPQVLCDVTYSLGGLASASWGRDGNIYFGRTSGAEISRVPDTGGTPTKVTVLNGAERVHLWPEVLPDASAVLFTAFDATSSNGTIYVQSLTTGERHRLVDGIAPHFVPPGHLLFARGTTLLAANFNVTRGELIGAPVPIVNNVLGSRPDTGVQNASGLQGAPEVALSQRVFAYVPAVPASQRTLMWVDRTGAEQAFMAPSRAYFQPRLSPDGKRLIVAIAEEDRANLWLNDVSRGTLTRLTFTGSSSFPLWSPDARRVAFQSIREGHWSIFWKLADGSAADELLLTADHAVVPQSWSPDGGLLAYVDVDPVTLQDIRVLPFAGAGAESTRSFLRTPFAEGASQFSPDGRWVAYASNESGRNEVYVRPFPGPGEKFQVSTGGGNEPTWPRAGHELFYRNEDRMMVVDVTVGPRFAAGVPRQLFDRPYVRSVSLWPNYDVTPDGTRFVMIKSADEGADQGQVNVVMNWVEELKLRVPVPN
jgi:serine/threonine protein kinase/Tol biopolymer transport system component